MIYGNWKDDRHRWTNEEILFAAECWSRGMTQTEVADALAERFNFCVSRNSVATITRVYRHLFARRSQQAGRRKTA